MDIWMLDFYYTPTLSIENNMDIFGDRKMSISHFEKKKNQPTAETNKATTIGE